MVKTKNLLKTLSACAVVLALGGCGGSDDDGSIVACFTADRTVNYGLTTLNAPSGSVGANRSFVGPMTYGGQDVTGQKFFYPTSNSQYTETNYWRVASNGVTFVAQVNSNSVATPGSLFFPQNMSPGQTATNSANERYTLIGFETISLAGKTFSNTCHIKAVDTKGNTEEQWYAAGYGNIKQISSNGVINQYSGDL